MSAIEDRTHHRARNCSGRHAAVGDQVVRTPPAAPTSSATSAAGAEPRRMVPAPPSRRVSWKPRCIFTEATRGPQVTSSVGPRSVTRGVSQ